MKIGATNWWTCPNQPSCGHGGIFHDIEEMDDPAPMCCVEGCDCGHQARDPTTRLGHNDRNE